MDRTIAYLSGPNTNQQPCPSFGVILPARSSVVKTPQVVQPSVWHGDPARQVRRGDHGRGGYCSSARLHEWPALFAPNPQLVQYAGFPLNQGLNKLPLLPSRHTFQIMAKAAVAFYEAAV